MLKARVFLEGDSLPLVNGSLVVFEASFANSIVKILGDGVTTQDVNIVQIAVFTPIEAAAGTRRQLASKTQSTMIVVDFFVGERIASDFSPGVSQISMPSGISLWVNAVHFVP